MNQSITFFLLILLSSLAFSGCGGKKYVLELDDRFSYNVVKTPYWYPHEKMELDPAQTEVIERIGVPDYIRFWWLRDGSPITSHDLSGKTNEDLEMDFNTMKQTWIFYDREEEVHFTRNGASYEVRDLPELIKLICDYGDPGEVKVHGMNNAGQLRETWIWIDHGLKVTLLDKVEVDRDYITATGAGTWLGK